MFGLSIIYFITSLFLSNPNLRIIDRKIENIEAIINNNKTLTTIEFDIAMDHLHRLKIHRYGIIIREPLD